MALQCTAEIYLPLSGNARDLVLRVGIRRERFVGKKMSCTPYCLSAGSRRGLDGGAHAYHEAHQSIGTDQIHYWRISLGLWEDQSGHAYSHHSWLESGNSWG